MMERTQWIEEIGNAHDHEIQRLDGFDDCVIGLADRAGMNPVLVYDKALIIAKLMLEDETSYIEAEEHFEANILGAWMGDGTPVFLVTKAVVDDADED